MLEIQITEAMVVDLKLWIVVLADLGTLLLALLLGVSILSPNFWERRRRRLPDGHQNPKVQTPIEAIRAVRVIFSTADLASF